jgi:hypothetical protein
VRSELWHLIKDAFEMRRFVFDKTQKRVEPR